jgi:hypothetical protein
MLADKSRDSKNKKGLSAMPKVVLAEAEKGSPMKFVFAKVIHGAEECTVIKGRHVTDAAIHKKINEELENVIKHEFEPDATIEVQGAGWLLKEPDEKNIWLWGRSMFYETPDYGEVKKLLAEAYPDYNIIIVNELLSAYPRLRAQFSIIERQSAAGAYPAKQMAQIKKILAQKPKEEAQT